VILEADFEFARLDIFIRKVKIAGPDFIDTPDQIDQVFPDFP
jgi:hypothetical protein